MSEPTINFTVSMWNRTPHLVLLLDDLYEIAKVDPNVALQICAFEGDDATFGEIRQIVDNAPCTAVLNYRTDAFGNGLGHNVATGGIEPGDIVVPIAVDICMPPDITQRIRPQVEKGKSIYYPLMYQKCKDGKLAERGGGGALIAAYKSDWVKAGGMQPARCPWGGDNRFSGAEDIVFGKRIKELNLVTNRPTEQDLFCRWHLRHLSNPFYRTLRGRKLGKLLPWMTVVAKDGKER